MTTPFSTYYDLSSWFNTGYSTGTLPAGTAVAPGTVVANVALVLDRANDPTALLSADWGTRQKMLADLNAHNTLWSTYGASQASYDDLVVRMGAAGVTVLGQGGDGYVSSAAARTLWVQVTSDNFNTLFGGGATLKHDGALGYFWTGSLTLPSGVSGLYFDMNSVTPILPAGSAAAPAPLAAGPQGTGNASTANGNSATPTPPQQVAALYHFPLAGMSVQTDALALLEPGSGSAPSAGSTQTLAQQLGVYRAGMQIDPNVSVIGVQPGGTPGGDTSERALDIGVATAVNPNSALILYAGSGGANGAQSEPYTAYQAAFWDLVNNPSVVSSSYRLTAAQASPGSPFMAAARELFIDAALRNISVFQSSGDGGSSYEVANGLTNVAATRASPYSVIVGGSSISLEYIAAVDPTLYQHYVVPALVGDRSVLWQLVAGGLTSMPQTNGQQWFAEAVWNRYTVTKAYAAGIGGTMSPSYWENQSGNGGVDGTQAKPWFQSALLPLTPLLTSDGSNLTGRALPDVTALASGNMSYYVPNADMVGTRGDGGTSASTPLWASLALQINAIFHDQHLPKLGYMTDLLYIAAAIEPGAFNDVTLGNDVSSFLNGVGTLPYNSAGGALNPTGFGYYAGPGFDLASGLGSPNGLLLARALTTIAHHQWTYNDRHGVLDSDGHGGWVSGGAQDLLLQVASGGALTVGFTAGGQAVGLSSGGSDIFAWTPRLAQQVLQPDFDANLVRLFDKGAQGTLSSAHVDAGVSVSATIGGAAGNGATTQLTAAYGFADFQTDAGNLRVARPVAVAETVGGASDQMAVVRVRQNGTDSLAVTFYKVDDLGGAIGNLHPGDPGYAAAVQGRAYQLAGGSTSLGGPGYGNFEQTLLTHVNPGDIVAMQLTNNTHGTVFSAFASGNETVGGQYVGHLWNYGLNTWGWEDTWGGGDRDYNDLVVGLDFTSAYGRGWLA